MKQLLLLTGPQGSGNHIFSRIFSANKLVCGWTEILDKYWVPTDEDKFAKYFINPELLTKEIIDSFGEFDYYVTDISYPFVYNGVKHYPKINEFRSQLESLGFKVTTAVIVRDQHINTLQQQRVRGEATLPYAMKYYKDMKIDAFLDLEALFLHKERYVEWVSKILDFPVPDFGLAFKFHDESPNAKYVSYVIKHWLDETVKKGLVPFDKRCP
ncbi:hypothetical protein EB001_04070 [bacterium]|nr:hypothetical protein [bacterium]